MVRFLKLFNTFTRTLNNVQISGQALSPYKRNPTVGSFYICGPTVYSDSHLGHALTYLRADLFRRFMRTLFNTNLHTVMNITDIDDKILEQSKIQGCDSFSKISEFYYRSFLEDMKSLRILPADLYVKVTQQIHIITAFIKQLEKDGFAYISSNGDVCFKISSLKNYQIRLDPRREDTNVKDFVLWKAAKPNEPVWNYNSADGKKIPGRPGWHVQCSAISSAFFGNELDFHFGGKDLIFPHHYNEEACCCAFHQLDTSKSIHVWAKNWLHSGHLILRDTKMSKSIGNVVTIKEFIKRSSVNALRLLCIYSHYRTDLEYSEDLIDKINTIDHKLNSFNSFLVERLYETQNGAIELDSQHCEQAQVDEDIEKAIFQTQEEIIDGVCDDFHLDKGLESILSLSKLVYSKNANKLKARDLISLLRLLREWCDVCGISYDCTGSTLNHEDPLFKLLSDFRKNVRSLSLEEIRAQSTSNQNLPKKLLQECDNIRKSLDELGFVYRDPKS